jgi:hypothetical protein
MKRYLILFGLLVLLLLGLIVYYVLLSGSHTDTQGSSSPSFPVTDSQTTNQNKPPATSVPTSTGVGSIATASGTVVTRDFLHNGTTVQDPHNPGQYILAGTTGSCLGSGVCPSGAPASDYTVVYFSEDKSLIVTLTTEPIGQARHDAEQFLLSTLGVSQDTLCSSIYQVLTPESVNTTFSGTNLGFSFCPGATALP